MRHPSNADPSEARTPVSVEAAFRRVRLLVGALLLARVWSAGSLPTAQGVLLIGAFWSVNIISSVAERQDERDRVLLGVVQLLADALVVLLVAWAQHEHTGAESADWAVLVLPAIEGAIRFRVAGAFASWLVLAGGYSGANMASSPSLPAATVAERLTVVLLVALPVGYLADHLVAEIAAHRRGRQQAEQRSALLRTAALGGWRTSRVDVDEILDVIRSTVIEMGFAEPHVFELAGGDFPTPVRAQPVRGSKSEPGIAADDDGLLAADAARRSGRLTTWPPETESGERSEEAPMLVALPIPVIDEQFVALTACWPDPTLPYAAPLESLELFTAQAGASLRNAQVHWGLVELKDRLDHEASHDPLTELANRRRFADELERTAGRGRPGDFVGVLFLDLDGFKNVNDRYGHEAGNELLVLVAARLRSCVRPGDLVARIGGDEFTVMMTRLESVAPAAAIAERICNALSQPFDLDSQVVHISTSVGVALAPADLIDTADLLRRADAAMYRAKSHGKARWMMDSGSLQPAGDGEPGCRKNP